MAELQFDGPLARLTLRDPGRRNALSSPMFEAIEQNLLIVEQSADVSVLLMAGEGPAFCSGFDLQEAVNDAAVLPRFIEQLSGVIRRLRRMRAVVVAAVHGHALAGGCAIVSAADIVVAERSAKLGYPVHVIGVSPAVTLPTLLAQLGAGPTRALALSGELITGEEAHRRGLVHHLAPEGTTAHEHAQALARAIAAKPPGALCATKGWVNELEGALDDARFGGPAGGSGEAATKPESRSALLAFWAGRQAAAAVPQAHP